MSFFLHWKTLYLNSYIKHFESTVLAEVMVHLILSCLCGSHLWFILQQVSISGMWALFKECVMTNDNAVQINNVINTRLCRCLLRQYTELRLHVESWVTELLINTQPSQHDSLNYWPLSGWFRTMILLWASRTFVLLQVGLHKTRKQNI